ncbi:MAG: DNA polymerase I [Candidatus Yanofskybacteria bacterium]|nr:DNA polymerase I [Candidatus Yanofskybacteria bacterium]
MRKLVLIDSNALVHRAFHALPPTLTSPKGVLTNAVYGFTSVLLKMIKDLKPDYIAATYDLAGPTFRHEEFAEYKAHREKAPDELYAQIPLTKEVLKAFGIPIYEKQGFEADDVIGALAELGKKEKNIQVVIVTGDLDTLQLVDGEKVVVFTLRKGLTDTMIYNEEEVRKRYGLNPDQVVDYKGLKGDPSDNIPGVPGIGDKTASMLVQKYGSIEGLYKKLEKTGNKEKLSPKLIEKLIENKDLAIFSKKLSTIIRDVPIGFSLEKSDWRKNLSRQDFEKTLKELGFYSLVKRFDEMERGTNLAGQDKPLTLDLGIEKAKEEIASPAMTTQADIEGALDVMAKSRELAFDIREGIFGFTNDGKNFISFDLQDLKKSKKGLPAQAGSDRFWKTFATIFENEKILKYGHDLKNLSKVLIEKGVHIQGVNFDTKIAAYLIKADRKDYELRDLYFNEINEELGLDMESRLQAVWRLKGHLWERLKGDNLVKVFEEIEMPLVQILAEMELVGIKIDLNSLKILSKLVNKEAAKLEKEIYKLAGIEFNINSPAQMKDVLFEKLQLKGKVRKTGKGALSTAAPELEKLSAEHPIIDLILKYRELQKLRTTYIEPFPRLVDPKTERLHTTLNQTGTVTGRLSSQDPNLQNIPVKTELGQEFRKAFIASSGYKLISFDYSQLELRIAAHISGDKKMTAAFKRGEDIHTRTAAEIFEVAPENVTPSMRREAKTLNFGLLYGMGLLGFQRASGVSRDRAREFIDRYMNEFSGIAKYMEEMRLKARKEGFVETIFGRRRYLPEINSGMPQLVAQAERMAINMPVQGTEADLLKISMIRINDLIHKEYGEGDINMLLQIHDEILFEAKNSLIEKVSPQIKNIMENVHQLDVPLIVDVKSGNNWSDMEST